MKLRTEDWIRVPYDASLPSAGALLTCRSIQEASAENWPASSAKLQDSCTRFAAELAIRRWLEAQCLLYRLRLGKPFTRAWHPGLQLGDPHIERQSVLLCRRRQIRRVRRNPAWLLDAEAHVPTSILTTQGIGESDLVLIAILIGLVTRSISDIQKARDSRLPIYLNGAAPDLSWISSPNRPSLGRIEVLCRDLQTIRLERAGWSKSRHVQVESLNLEQGLAAATLKHRGLRYVHPECLPSSPLLNSTDALVQGWDIPPRARKNLWIYGSEELLAGWLTKRAFMQPAQRLAAGTRLRLGGRLRHESFVLAIHKLRPMQRLIQLTRQG